MLSQMNRNFREAREEGSGMIFALVILMVALMLTMTFGAFALTNLKTAQTTSSLSVYSQGIDSAFNNALTVANSDPSVDTLASKQGVSNAVTGSLTATRSSYGTKWRWYSERIAVEGQPVSYYIYATSYTNTPSDANAKTQRALLTPKTVSGANVTTSGAIEYSATDTGSFQWGLFGYNEILIPGVITGSYDSSRIPTIPGTLDQSQVQIASLGNLNLTGTTGVQVFNKFGSGTLSTRCTGGATCTALEVINQSYTANLSGIAVRVSIDCPNAASSYPDFRASTSSYLISGCYNNIYLDATEQVPAYASAASPIKMYAKGNISISPNVSINTESKAPALQIYSQTGSSASFAAGTTGVTTFNGLLGGNSLTCSGTSDGTATTKIRIYGSLACNKINFGSNTVIAQDKQAFTVTSSTDKNIWSYTKYENVY